MSDILPLCETFIQALDETSQSAAMSNPAIGEATLQIYRLIQATKDSQIIKVCLHALLKAGRFGRILAARFVHSKAISERSWLPDSTHFPMPFGWHWHMRCCWTTPATTTNRRKAGSKD